MNPDTSILLAFHTMLQSPMMDRFFSTFTHLSDGGAIWIVFCILLLIPRKTRPIGLVMGIALIIDGIFVNLMVKPLFMRLRPYEALNLKILIQAPIGTSFPSGHSSISFTGASVYFMMAKNEHSKILRWIPLAIAFLIALSRMYLLVHYPSDVITGAVIGVGIAWLCVHIYKQVFSQKYSL